MQQKPNVKQWKYKIAQICSTLFLLLNHFYGLKHVLHTETSFCLLWIQWNIEKLSSLFFIWTSSTTKNYIVFVKFMFYYIIWCIKAWFIKVPKNSSSWINDNNLREEEDVEIVYLVSFLVFTKRVTNQRKEIWLWKSQIRPIHNCHMFISKIKTEKNTTYLKHDDKSIFYVKLIWLNYSGLIIMSFLCGRFIITLTWIIGYYREITLKPKWKAFKRAKVTFY